MKHLVITLLLLTGTAFAQDAFIGDWQGEIGPDVLNLGVAVHFEKSDEGISGTIDIPAQASEGMPLNT